jgi:hypothetical protein
MVLVGLCLAPLALTGQQAAYGRVSRLVGAIRIAGLMSSPSAASRPSDERMLSPAIPPLASPAAPSRRRVLRLNLTDRLQLRATSGWLASGPAATLGLAVRF